MDQTICEFGGGCRIDDLNNIMSNNAKMFKLCYSRTKRNRWNLWVPEGGMTLSFVLNKGLMIPSISGIKKLTLDKFYSTCPNDVDSWVKLHINTYLKEVKSYLEEVEAKKEQEGWEQYMHWYYEQLRLQEESVEEEPWQKYNRENDEFLTKEEYESMFPEEKAPVLVKTRKSRKRKDTVIPGQLSLFDQED